MKPSQLIPFIELALKNNRPIIITGEPGVGKSDTVSKAIENVGYDSHVRQAVCLEPIHFTGFPCLEKDAKNPEKSHARYVPFGDTKIMMEATKPTVFFYDDIGQGSQSVQKAMMSLLLLREVNGQKISEHVRFIAATNRKGDGAGVGKIIQPFISRQKAIVPFTLSVDDWIAWAHKNNVPPMVIAFIHFRGKTLLHNFDPNKVDETGNDMIQQPCPRTVTNFGEWLNLGLSIRKDREVFVGTIGEEFVREYECFVDVFDKLGDMPKRICEGKDVDCPSDPATLYALSSCLAQRAGDSKDWENLSVWSKGNMPKEFQQVLLLDAEATHGEKVYNTSIYTQWVSDLKGDN